MNQQLLIDINDKLDKLLNPKKHKATTNEQRAEEQVARIMAKYAKKNLLKKQKE